METTFRYSILAGICIFLLSVQSSEQLQSSHANTLFRIRGLLNYPAVLRSWNRYTDFCNTEPTSSLTVVCYEDSITQLHIIGDLKAPPLSPSFSIDSFVTTLVKLPSLKVLTLVSLGLWGPLPGKISRLSSLEIFNISSNYFNGTIPPEISSLLNLQTLIFDDNMFSGQLPNGLDSLSALYVLSLRNNSLDGSLPDALGSLKNLRVLALSHNYFYGEMPDLSSLTNLQVLDLEDNALGPQFPHIGHNLVILALRKNRFSSGIPAEVSSYYQLQRLDLSANKFVGPFPPLLLSLPSITYLDISGNRFTGMLFSNLSCNAELKYVNMSSNLLTGSLPKCLANSKDRVVLYAKNCLATGDENQFPFSFCRNEALAVGIVPHRRRQKKLSRVIIAAGTIGGIIGSIALLGLVFLAIKRRSANNTTKAPPARLIAENASIGYTSKLLSSARYISQSMKLGALGLPAYRTFSLEELEEATSNFDTSSFIGEGSHGQMYRGQLKDGSVIAIRCLKMGKSHSTQNFTHHLELVSKLRHRHLVSALGHCFECYLDDSSVSRVFLVFEYVPNGTLRSWISDYHTRQTLTWPQRIAAAVGIAKGVQFLHTGIVPGVFSNNLKITDILLDHNFVAKISSYNLPLLTENVVKIGHGNSAGSKGLSVSDRVKQKDKTDVYDIGVILLEIIMGRQFDSKIEVDDVKEQLRASMVIDYATRKSMVDPIIHEAYSDESIKTMMEICSRCLLNDPSDRPSVEDVLWNLQFAAQVQDAWRTDSQSSEGTPGIGSPSQPQDLQLSIH